MFIVLIRKSEYLYLWKGSIFLQHGTNNLFRRREQVESAAGRGSAPRLLIAILRPLGLP